MRPRTGTRAGFTLVEALLAAVVLAMAASAVLLPYTAGAQNAAQDARVTLAVSLTQDLTEEILSKAFDDPDGSESGETTRQRWDDVSDYAVLDEAEGQIRGFDGSLVTDPAAAKLSRHARVTNAAGVSQVGGETGRFKSITVEVDYRSQPMVTLNRLVYCNE